MFAAHLKTVVASVVVVDGLVVLVLIADVVVGVAFLDLTFVAAPILLKPAE